MKKYTLIRTFTDPNKLVKHVTPHANGKPVLSGAALFPQRLCQTIDNDDYLMSLLQLYTPN